MFPREELAQRLAIADVSFDEIEITVWNNHSGQDVCTLEFRTYELTINLGSDFDPGETYEVEVNNDEGVIFEAE